MLALLAMLCSLRELYATLECSRPVVAVLETDPARGGYTLEEARQECPKPLRSQLFPTPPVAIDWHRVGAFQRTTLLCMLERAFPSLAGLGLRVNDG